ncbi:MAG: oligosaccharide flippase family protein [Nevskia sp.]|nr:oligosaccharide flippase family protein [Nevskia sp.]
MPARSDRGILPTLRGFAALSGQYLFAALLPLAVMPRLLQRLGAGEVGSIAVWQSLILYAGMVVQYGFNLTGPVLLAGAADAAQRRATFSGVLAARALLALLAMAAAALVAATGLLPVDAVTPLRTGIAMGAIALMALNATWYHQGMHRFWAPSLCFSLGVVAAAALVLAAVDGPGDRDLALLALLLPQGVGAIGTFVLAANAAGRPQWPPAAAIASLLRRGLPVFASQFVAALYNSAGVLVVAALCGSGQAGIYSAAERLAYAAQAGLALLFTAGYPRLAAMASGARPYFRLALSLLALYCAGVAVLAAAWLLVGPRLAAAYFGAAYARSGSQLLWAFLGWMALAGFAPSLTGRLVHTGRAHRVFALTLALLAVSFAAGWLNVRAFGARGWVYGLLEAQLLTVACWILEFLPRRRNAA